MPEAGVHPEIESLERRREMTRTLTERQRAAQDEGGFLDSVAKIAALGMGAALLGRLGARNDHVIDAVHKLGQFGRRVAAPVRGIVRGMLDEWAGVSRGPASPVRSFDLLEQLTESMAVVRQAEFGGANSAHVQQLVRTTRQGIREYGFDQEARAGVERFRYATVGDIMDQGGLQSAIGQRGFETISEAHRRGMVGRATRLTRGSWGLMVERAQKDPQQFIDTRWAAPRTILRGAANLVRSVQIPFIGFRPGDLLIGIMRPFGDGHFAGQIGRNLEVAQGVKTSPTSTMNFVIGGRLMEYTDRGFVQRAEGLRLGAFSRVGQGHLERYGNADWFLNAKLTRDIRSGAAGVGAKVAHATGIGTQFRSRDPLWKSLFVDPIRRRVQGGEVVAHEFVPLREHANFFEKVKATVEAQEAGINPERALNQAVPGRRPLSKWERFKSYFGMSRQASVVDAGFYNYGQPLRAEDLLLPGPEYTGRLAGRRMAVPGHDVVAPTHLGKLPERPSVPNEFYAYAGKGGGLSRNPAAWVAGQMEAAIDVLHYGTNRLNDLFSATIGVGFRPSVGKGIGGGVVGLGKNIAKIYGIYHGAQAAVQYANYADFLVESTAGQLLPDGWDSPKKLGIRAYQGFRIAQTALREGTGVASLSRYAEDLMPGSTSSALSDFARTIAPIAIGVSRAGKAGLIGGAATTALIGGSDPGKRLSDVIGEFKGERLVPVRKSRWWMMGRQPWEGGQIDHFAPHWTVSELSDYEYTDVKYGSKSEYFSNVARIPTPHNLFGLVPLLQEGGPFGGGDLYLAKKHALDRPYPNTPGVDSKAAVQDAAMVAVRGPYDAPTQAGERLGLGTAGGMPVLPDENTGVLGRIKDAGAELAELTGAFKFLLWDLPGFSKDTPPKVASYETINSQARSFWDANVGGLFGLTELYRRFNMPEEAKQGINTVPNMMPSWMPGSRSDNPEDRTYHIDFTTGDPYARIGSGEARLPGAGYETLHRLHSGAPGVYDAMDRFMILADVAPHSQAYTQYRTIVQSWMDAGVLDASWGNKFQTAKRQVRDKMERYKFYDRRFTGLITDPKPEDTERKYNLVEKAIGGVYEVFAHDVVPKAAEVVPIAGTILADKLFPIRSPVEHYKRFQVYGEEFGDWRSPYNQLVRPKIHQLMAQDPLTATAGGAMFGLFGANPVAALVLGSAGAVGVGGSSAMRAMQTGQMEDGYIPEFRQREFALQEYFDNLQYTRSKILAERAGAIGDTEVQEHFTDQMRRTVASVNFGTKDTHTFLMQAMKGLNRNQRSYLMPFLGMPEEAKQEMIKYMPEHVAPVFVRAGGMQNDTRFAEYRDIMKTSSDDRVASYFAQNGGLPNASWGGWHPDVPMDAIKIKMIDAGAGGTSSDIHKFDLFGEHRYRASRFAGLNSPEIARNLKHVSLADGVTTDLVKELEGAGFENVRFRYTVGRSDRDQVRWNVRRSPLHDLEQRVREVLR